MYYLCVCIIKLGEKFLQREKHDSIFLHLVSKCLRLLVMFLSTLKIEKRLIYQLNSKNKQIELCKSEINLKTAHTKCIYEKFLNGKCISLPSFSSSTP